MESFAEPLVDIADVSKSFDGSTVVLDDINLLLMDGEFVSLIGPSGCGKSTLLKLIASLSPVSAGAINFAHQTPAVSDRLSYVFQEPTLMPWLTVSQNVELPMKLAGISVQERRAAAENMLNMVGLRQVCDHYPRQLSGGMKMRVSIARALSVKPALLLLDEPFGALDEMTRDALNEELLRLRAQEAWTALFVTHSVSEAVFLSSRIVVLSANPGRISAILDVPLDYPRTAQTRQTEAFAELVLQATRALHAVHSTFSKQPKPTELAC